MIEDIVEYRDDGDDDVDTMDMASVHSGQSCSQEVGILLKRNSFRERLSSIVNPNAGGGNVSGNVNVNMNATHHNDTAKVEFASHTRTFTYLHPNLSEQISRDMLAATEQQRQQRQEYQQQNLQHLNDMGPPLSRTLLLAASLHRGGGGSLRSFSSATEAPSDVVAHVDTDDCGGSMSEVSREDEDNMMTLMVKDDDIMDPNESSGSGSCCGGGSSRRMVEVPGLESGRTPKNLGDKPMEDVARVVNGRVSPGGTIYKVMIIILICKWMVMMFVL